MFFLISKESQGLAAMKMTGGKALFFFSPHPSLFYPFGKERTDKTTSVASNLPIQRDSSGFLLFLLIVLLCLFDLDNLILVFL